MSILRHGVYSHLDDGNASRLFHHPFPDILAIDLTVTLKGLDRPAIYLTNPVRG
jgi:hypothetical protein